MIFKLCIVMISIIGINCFLPSIKYSENAGKLQADTSCKACNDLNELIIKIRNGEIFGDSAKAKFSHLITEIEKVYFTKKEVITDEKTIYFPLKGYSATHIGGKNGNGHVVGNYNFYDSIKRKSHPAQDIFIFDKNQDKLDDRTGKRVEILSMTNGIVVGLENQWQTNSSLRGGKYVWIYQPAQRELYYYAHNDTITITIGKVVKAGEKIAELGRSGLNAYKKRSPTHLHIMCLKVDKDGELKPKNLYQSLLRAKLIKN